MEKACRIYPNLKTHQCIAWDRSQPGIIYGIIRATAKERAEGGGHKVTVFRLVEKP